MTDTPDEKHRKRRGGNTSHLRPPWQPGQSGNPNGRPKKVAAVVDKAQDNADKAIVALIKLINSDDERVRLQAAMAILDRAMGKPKQTIDDSRKTEVTDYTTDELRALAGLGSQRTAETEDGSRKPDRLQ